MGIELFERAAEARGRILRVEQIVAANAERDPTHGAGILLTFDIGSVLVAADRLNGRLALRHLESTSDLEEIERISLDDEEPWWRVAGNVMTRAWPAARGDGAESTGGEISEIRMQFREDDENPKVISLRYEAGDVWVGQEAIDGR